LPGRKLRLLEIVEVMHGPHEVPDQALLAQVCQGVAADGVLCVQDVERAVLQQVGDVSLRGRDACSDLLDHVRVGCRR